MKIVSIVGARPEFIQAAPICRALRQSHQELLVHTGQHYDQKMCRVFFDDLNIPHPDYDLGVGSSSHGRQTAEVLLRIEQVLLSESPDLVIVRGDTNSTLGGALAASKLHVPLAHIEAGERSFNRRMPEEVNRLMVDWLANVHFCASQKAVSHLAAEGIWDSVFQVGDVMLDAMLEHLPKARRTSHILDHLDLQPGRYSLVTSHRPENTDDPFRLNRIIAALNRVPETVVFPAHPRTKEAIGMFGAYLAPNVKLIEPVGYLDMLMLEENARLIATDSGGVQREAYFLRVPCLTLRDETEWVETVEAGWNRLVGADQERILAAWVDFSPPAHHPPLFGDGTAAQRIAEILDQGTLIYSSSQRPAEISMESRQTLEIQRSVP